jgi:acyl carrier protein
MTPATEIKQQVRRYVCENFLPAGQGGIVDDDTPLISSGLIDSIGMIGLVAFIESRFGVEFLPREVAADKLNTIGLMDELIRKKLERGAGGGIPR